MKTDRELQEDVLEELDWEPSVNASRIGVEVKDGVVTLEGKVDSYTEKWAAERAVKRVSGVRSLAMDLEVALNASLSRTDTDIATAAKNVIDWNASIPKDAVKIVVEKGWVTLSGDVPWAFIREAADRAVRGLLGVKGVINQIAISPPVEPRNIKTKIEAALYRRAHVDASAITVGVNKSTVTLSGKVDSLAEREIIEQAAWSAPGVKSVVDNLIVT
ncbi:BON domain-containing protein [Dyella japonica]|uniref:Osmotically-inducible protein OsmY n=1 Tax=Dyella japonica TaxID=231455 RepID=A0ABV2JP77_9GAMM